MNNQLEQLLNRQLELISKLQAKAEEVLDWKPSSESAEVTEAYFQALESAVESLDSLSDFYEDFGNLELEDEDDEDS